MALLTTGQIIGIEEKLQAAEAVLQGIEPDDETRDLIGRIADTRGRMNG
jgi:LuxR family maltose regulon positive regulatory protein